MHCWPGGLPGGELPAVKYEMHSEHFPLTYPGLYLIWNEIANRRFGFSFIQLDKLVTKSHLRVCLPGWHIPEKINRHPRATYILSHLSLIIFICWIPFLRWVYYAKYIIMEKSSKAGVYPTIFLLLLEDAWPLKIYIQINIFTRGQN